jgi:cathepsin H
MSLTVSLPYVPMHVPTNVITRTGWGEKIQRVDYYGGLEVDITNEKLGAAKVVYVNGRRKCLQNEEPHKSQNFMDPKVKAELEFTAFLPDLSNYQFAGSVLHGGLEVDKYTFNQAHPTVSGDSSRMFDRLIFLYDPLERKPVKWSMWSRNAIAHSHSDEYIVTYHDYSSHLYQIDIPKECNKEETIMRGNFTPKFFTPETYKVHPVTGIQPPTHHMNRNMDFIASLNEKHKGKATFSANHFIHMSYEQIIRSRTGLAPRKTLPEPTLLLSDMRAATPEAFDWREVNLGVTNRVKDQGFCGSCWSFSFISAVESATALLTGKIVTLPEQFILDCGWTDNSNACDGGLQADAARMIVDRFQGHIPTEEEYGTYLTVDGMCKSDRVSGHGAVVTGWVVVPPRQDDLVMQALLRQPLAISIAVPEEMVWFEKGILDVESCAVSGPNDLVHATNLVGYGTHAGTDYWTMRNSWSTHWGDKGHIKIVRGERDCGISLVAEYPTVTAPIAGTVGQKEREFIA